MGKNIVVGLFLVACFLAALAFFNRESRNGKNQFDFHNAKDPRLVLEEFTVFKYEGYTVKETLSAKLGYFLEPNILELYGKVKGLRRNSKEEFFSAESSITYFEARGLTQLLRNARVIKTELENQVSAGVDDHTLRTEYAEFIAPQHLVRTDLPVKIESPRGQFSGEKGFEYYLVPGLMTVHGPMVGILEGRSKLE